MTNYIERIMATDEEDEELKIVHEALAEAAKDMETLMNKWKLDMPILLAGMKQALPHVERFSGEHGRHLADELLKIGVCIAVVQRKE